MSKKVTNSRSPDHVNWLFSREPNLVFIEFVN